MDKVKKNMLETKKILEQLDEMNDGDLAAMVYDINRYDGSFEFVDAYELEELASMMDAYELARAIIYGNVTNVCEYVRFNGYGNLENVSEYDIVDDCRTDIEYIAEWIERNYDNDYIDFDSYGLNIELCDCED